MQTLKSRKRRQGRWDRYNATPGAHARRQAAREAASIARPAPHYPEMAPLTGDWLGGRINGQTVIAHLTREPGHRCDQWRVEIDGRTVAGAVGLVDLCLLLRERFGKVPSKRMLASMRERYSAGEEADAAAAGAIDSAETAPLALGYRLTA